MDWYNITEEGEDFSYLLDLLDPTTANLSYHEYVALDIETTGLRPYHGDKIAGISLYFPHTDQGFYLPYRHGKENLSFSTWERLKTLLFNDNTTYILFNAKFDLTFLALEGFGLPACIEEVMVAAKLLNENEHLSNFNSRKGAYQLKRLSRKYLGAWAVAGEEELQRNAEAYGVDPKKGMYRMPSSMVAYYAIMDTYITWRLREFYRPALDKWGQWDLYKDRSQFILDVLLRMEMNGMRIDVDKLYQYKAEYEEVADELRGGLVFEAGKLGLGDFNPASSTQLRRFLQLSGYNIEDTRKETLMPLAKQGAELIQQVLDYRTAYKAVSTFYAPYLKYVDESWDIHPSIHPMGTVSGRLSCSNPNLQQVPRTKYLSNTDYEPMQYAIKEVFIPRPGYTWVQVDYKQLELRLAVFYAGEETMRQMFLDGTDMHQYTADQLGITRFEGKTANFSLLYGMGAVTGAVRLETSVDEARRIIEGWHELYPAFRQAYANAEASARVARDADGLEPGPYKYIRLANNRIRHFHEFAAYKQVPPYYTAWNFIVQGTAAIVTDASIHKICEGFSNDELRPMMQVHDAFVFEVRDDRVDEIVPQVVDIMTDWEYDPPMAVDVSMSKESWKGAE